MSKGPRHYPWMRLSVTDAFVPLAKRRGAAKVARSYRGFYAAFKKAKGQPTRMGSVHPDTPGRQDYPWWQRRNEFIARHMAQVKKRREKLWDKDGNPTNRHLGLIMWAYTPDPDGVLGWLEAERRSPQRARRNPEPWRARFNPRSRARRNSALWKPAWDFIDLRGTPTWTLYGLGKAALRVRSRTWSSGKEAFTLSIWLDQEDVEAFVRGADALGHDAVGDGKLIDRKDLNHYWLAIVKSFPTLEAAQQAGIDIYLSAIAHMSSHSARVALSALPPEALVRMDQVLSTRGATSNPRPKPSWTSVSQFRKWQWHLPGMRAELRADRAGREFSVMFITSHELADELDATAVQHGMRVRGRTWPNRAMSTVSVGPDNAGYFDTLEEAKEAAEDLLLLALPRMPEKKARPILMSLTEPMLVRMDQLLSGQ